MEKHAGMLSHLSGSNEVIRKIIPFTVVCLFTLITITACSFVLKEVTWLFSQVTCATSFSCLCSLKIFFFSGTTKIYQEVVYINVETL